MSSLHVRKTIKIINSYKIEPSAYITLLLSFTNKTDDARLVFDGVLAAI